MTTFTKENLTLEQEAKKHIYAMLRKYGYEVEDLGLPEWLSLKEFLPEQKKILNQWKASKAGDSHVFKMTPPEFYIIEAKGKHFDIDKDIVNQNEYDVLWHYKQCGAPILYFVWVKENNKIYVHGITNPSDFDTDFISGKKVYIIPEDKIREIRPKENIPLRLFIK